MTTLAPTPERTAVRPQHSRRRRRRSPGGGLTGYGFLAPFFVVFLIFGAFPLVYTAWVSLHDVDLFTPSEMTNFGFHNYAKLFSDPNFWNALKNTITLGLLACGPQLLIALGVAYLLTHKLRGSTAWRVAILLPYATSVAAATLIFSQLFAYDHGLFNTVLNAVGMDKVNWQSGSFSSQLAIATIVTWRWTGYNALIYLAAMQTVSQDLYEAAAIDGASKWRQFRSVTLPGIQPTIVFTIVISTIGAAQLFVEPLLYEGGSLGVQGGVSKQYQTLTLYMYQQGWPLGHLGYASAIAFAILILVVLLTVVNALFARRRLAGGEE